VWTYIPKQYITKNARAGSPLEDHTRWYQKSTASSASGWDDFGYKIIVKPNTDAVRNIALGDETEAYQYEQAIFTATMVANPTGGNNWMQPMARFKDDANLVGIRLRGGKAEVVQKYNNSWSTLKTANATPGEWKVQFSTDTVTLHVDGNFILTVGHNIPGLCYYGCSWHNWVDAEQVIISNYSVEEVIETQTPKMSSPNDPYGLVTASNEFDSSYPAWEGMDGIVSSANSWLTVNTNNADIPYNSTRNTYGHYHSWFYDRAAPMIPTRIEITPRGGMTSTWYSDNNPQGIVVFIIKPDATPIEKTNNTGAVYYDFDDADLVEVYRKEDIANWTTGSMRGWDIATNEYGIGYILYITKTNSSEGGGTYHTGFSHVAMFGNAPALTYLVDDNGDELVDDNGASIVQDNF
jgi:hypothetical protein